MKLSKHLKSAKGFTLVEVVVAIGLVALLLTGVLGLMAPASQNIDRNLSRSDAKRAADILLAEMNTFREYDQDGGEGVDEPLTINDGTSTRDITSAFEKALVWMNGCNDKSSLVLIYQYNGEVGQSREADGALEPFDKTSDDSKLQGEHFVVVPLARLKNVSGSSSDPADEIEAGVVSGKVFLAKFKGYERDATGLTLLSDYPDGTFSMETKSSSDIVEADGLASAQLEIYRMKSNSWSYLRSNMDLSRLGKPVYTTNVAFRR